MEAESNTGGFHHQAISFQSAGMGPMMSGSSSSQTFGNFYSHLGLGPNASVNNYSTGSLAAAAAGGGGMVFSGSHPCMIGVTNNSNNISNNKNHSTNLVLSQVAGPSSSPLLVDTVPGLKHDTGLAVEWSVDEQHRLEEGLMKYANEPNIMRYIKIAAMLHDKTVRDVALRCRWMMRKRRKQEDYNLAKKVKDRKDKLAETSVKTNICSVSPASYTLPINHHSHSVGMPSGALLGTRHLLEENNKALNEIATNLTTLKLQDNIELFFHARNNITAILNDMRNMPGIMSQMPPLPVFLNDELASSILPRSSQPMMFGSSSGIHLKQEPGC